jgi:membrane fusion protein (multidrug efflux system)
MTEGASKKRSRIVPVLIVIILLAAVGAFGAWKYFAGSETTDDAQVDGHINPVNAKIGGIVLSVQVEENQHVDAGAVLAKIDTRDYDIALAHAQADLADAQATYEAARAGLPIVSNETGSRVSASEASIMRTPGGVDNALRELDAAKARVSLAKARASEAQANYSKATKDQARLKGLVAKDEVSQQQYDNAASAAEASKAALDSAQAAIVEADSEVSAADARITQARGSFGQAQAEVEATHTGPQQIATTRARIEAAAAHIEEEKSILNQAKLNLEYTTIKAPVAGIVSRKNVEVGQVVQPGQPLMAVVSLDEVWITANFKETQLDKMRPGQAATISVDAYDGAKFPGRVESIAAATGARFSLLPPENASGNYVKVVQRVPVRIKLDGNADPQHVLRPGMSVDATIQIPPEH